MTLLSGIRLRSVRTHWGKGRTRGPRGAETEYVAANNMLSNKRENKDNTLSRGGLVKSCSYLRLGERGDGKNNPQKKNVWRELLITPCLWHVVLLNALCESHVLLCVTPWCIIFCLDLTMDFMHEPGFEVPFLSVFILCFML
ncbi:hypothetical protein CEXT_533191 [Caerostris extrusa]|uniref:Uncharacterized protein n=1 Tax=Caerostris extrusa TaxID=172846 RepID=A0AAV4MU25_CAEEX|nr:hypothetical protein CEXT_533191 [Caerostris extrusa]